MHKLRGHTTTTAIAPASLSWPNRPVPHRQLVLFDPPIDLSIGRAALPSPRDQVLADALESHIAEVAERLRWRRRYTESVRAGIRILLGLQHTPGGTLTATEIAVVSRLGLPARTIREILAEVGMLDDDRIPAIVTLFRRHIEHLPEQMRRELAVWFDVMHRGSTTRPRRHPRRRTTIELYLRWSLPTITAWAATGTTTLRTITRDDVLTALPDSGVERSQTGRALRSIFDILKTRQLVFANPTANIRTWSPADQPAMPADLDRVNEALHTTNGARAAVVALAIYHGLSAGQIRHLQLTDLHDRRLHIDNRVIPLAADAIKRLDAYISERAARWPDTVNPHLFIHFRTAHRHDPVGYVWLKHTVNYPGGISKLRQDRMLHEAHATNGDVRRLCDLFGISITTAERYTRAATEPHLPE